MSSAQAEVFSTHNLKVLGVLLFLAILLGEVVFSRQGEDPGAVMKVDTLEDIAARLRPVVVLKEMADNPMGSSAAISAVDQTPDQLYATACQACHAAGVAGAPKLGDVVAWNERLEKGIDALVISAINGIGAMPARGGSQLTDEQIKAIVEYILDESK